VVIPLQDHCAVYGEVKQVSMESIQEIRSHRGRLMEMIAVQNLPEPRTVRLCYAVPSSLG